MKLEARHYTDLHGSGLSAETIDLSGCYSATVREVDEILGFNAGPGLVFPYPGHNGDRGQFCRVKPNRPLKIEGQRRPAKYLSPRKSENRIYFPANLYTWQLTDARTTLLITEGEKKTLKANQDGLPCIGLAGVWSWRGWTVYGDPDHNYNTLRRVIPDLDLIEWNDREVLICFDSDIDTKFEVLQAEKALAAELRRRGARVYGLRLPQGEKGQKVGLDDYLLKYPPESVYELPKVDYQQTETTFPSRVMTGAAGSFAETYNQYMETPVSFLYFSYLTVLGTVLSNRLTIESELKPQPRLYVVLIGESADVRKSTAVDKTVEFFTDVLIKESMSTSHGVGSAEGLASQIKDGRPLLLVMDELKNLVAKCRIEGSVLLPCLTTLFESNRFHSATKKSAINLNDVYLSLLACCTQDTYTSMFTSTFLDIGFINRIWAVLDHSERKFAMPGIIPGEVKGKLAQKLRAVLRHVSTLSVPLSVDADALALFEDWYFTTPRTVFTKRLDTYGHRLMSLLAVNDLKTSVDAETMTKVLALLNYQAQVREQVDPIDTENKIAQLEERIKRLLVTGPMPKRELERRGHKTRHGIYLWNLAIKNLCMDSQINWNPKTKIYEKKG